MKNLIKRTVFILAILATVLSSCSRHGLQSRRYKVKSNKPKVECEKRVTNGASEQGYFNFGRK